MAPNHCVAASDGSNDIKVPTLPAYFSNNVGSLTANGWGCTYMDMALKGNGTRAAM